MKYIIIQRVRNGYKVKIEVDESILHSVTYLGYSKRESVKQARIASGMCGKRFITIEI